MALGFLEENGVVFGVDEAFSGRQWEGGVGWSEAVFSAIEGQGLVGDIDTSLSKTQGYDLFHYPQLYVKPRQAYNRYRIGLNLKEFLFVQLPILPLQSVWLYNIDSKMDPFPNLTPKEIYSLCSTQQLNGIEGYHIQKKYFDPLKQIQERQSLNIKNGQKSRKHVTKRGNFLDDQAKMHSAVPGPGHYIKGEDKTDKPTHKIKYGDKMTYLDEIIKQNKREKTPAPGQYNVVKTLKEEENQVKRLAAKKVIVPDRITYLDEVQYEANLIPGVGNYNPRKRAITEGARSQSNSRLGPDDWRKKHELMQKKKAPKSPDMRTYNPTTGDPTLFQNTCKAKHNKNFLGKVQRFKTSASGSGLNPAKYTVLQEWRGKDKKKVQRHGLQALSKPATKSVYYH